MRRACAAVLLAALLLPSTVLDKAMYVRTRGSYTPTYRPLWQMAEVSGSLLRQSLKGALDA